MNNRSLKITNHDSTRGTYAHNQSLLTPANHNTSLTQNDAILPSVAPNIMKDLDFSIDFPLLYDEYGKKICREFGKQILPPSDCFGEGEIKIELKNPIAKSIEFLQAIVSFWRDVDNQKMLQPSYVIKYYMNFTNKNQIKDSR